MLYIKSFKNHTEFQQIFGVREFEGHKARNNKILLSLLKDKELFHESVKRGDLELFEQKNLVDLRNIINERLNISGAKSRKLPYRLTLLGYTYYSDKYTLDDLNGICEDGTPNAVRYINNESGRVFKMKAGKFMKALIECTKFGKTLPKSIVIWLCEEFTRDWSAYTIGKLPKNKLYINDNFSDIYDSSRLKGYDEDSDSFVSCMVNKGFHSFYRDSVDAKAAYLEDEYGKIIARCIIFTDVYDEDDNHYRYAERQYSVGCNDIYKQALVDALIQAGEIDIYKKVGAGCHDETAIVDINGKSMAGKQFRISCDLEWEDTLSYQDTFKYYSMSRREAYNYDRGDYALDVTEGSLEKADEDYENNDPDEYDSYHDRDAYEVCTVYYHGGTETCDVDDREDFTYFKGEWRHEDDIVECEKCGKKILNPDYYTEDDGAFCSDLTDENYCCEDCRDEAELEYKKKYWHYSDYDEDWYEDEDDLTSYQKYNCITGDYTEKTISKDSFYNLLDNNGLHNWGGLYFDVINEAVGKPYGYETLIEFEIAV